LRRQLKGAEQQKKQIHKKQKESVGHGGDSLSVGARSPLTVALENPAGVFERASRLYRCESDYET
jgi:hypothetical protein